MISIAICDDESFITAKIEELLLDYGKKNAVDLDIEVFFDGYNLERSIKKGDKYDIIYLDIEMEKLDGVETAKRIRCIDETVLLIYVSSFENYLKDLFEVEPFRFIKKPIDKMIFIKYFEKALNKVANSEIYFKYKFNREVVKVPIHDIMYFESSKRTLYIITTENIQKFYGKLNDIEKQLQNCKLTFLRIHQSFLVNYKYVKKIGYDYTELTDGVTLQISEDRQKSIRQKYCQLIGGEVVD